MKNQKSNYLISLTLVFGLLFTFTSSCTYAIKGIKGNGKVVKQEREISSFSGIEVGGAFKVYLTQGSSETLTVEADENLLEVIETEVRGSTLRIRTTEDIRDSEALNIYITFKDLNELDVSGACELTGENKFKLGDLDLDCSGASDLMLKVDAKNMLMDCSGASQMDLYGSAESIMMDISGASHMDASDLEVKICEAEISGASSAKVNVSSELSAEVSGAGSLKYTGDPIIKSHEVSGAGSMRKY